jgi:hypothetical protein
MLLLSRLLSSPSPCLLRARLGANLSSPSLPSFDSTQQALLALPTNIGVTATLDLAYKKPTFANQFVMIKTELLEVKGRKAWVQGRIESLEGEVLVEAK